MKNLRINTIMIMLLFVTWVSKAQNITNGGFETWTAAGPTEICDGWSITPIVTKSTDMHSGNFAIKIIADTFYNPVALKLDTLPGIVNTGVQGMGPGTGVRGFAFTGRPDSMTGWYKYAPVGNDMPVFNVVLSKWNATTSTSDIISNTMYIGASQTAYTRFSFPINYLSTTTPDTANVELISSNSQPNMPILGSVLLVDDLSFIYNTPAGIFSTIQNENLVTLYPNPTTDKLFGKFNATTATSISATIVDAMGRTMMNITDTNLTQGIDVSHFAKGIYHIILVDEINKTTTSKTFSIK